MPRARRDLPGERSRRVAYVALLRAVNLGGSTQLSMDAVRRLFETLGFDDVRSLLNSGNLVFRGEGGPVSALESRIESAIDRATGRHVDAFVRSSSDWPTILSGNPFRTEAAREPARLTGALLKDAPAPGAWSALEGAIVGRERVEGAGRLAYILFPDGQGRSKLTPAVIERSLGTRATIRNWNTVLKIGAALGGLDGGAATSS